jgi:hypothetical protein
VQWLADHVFQNFQAQWEGMPAQVKKQDADTQESLESAFAEVWTDLVKQAHRQWR